MTTTEQTPAAVEIRDEIANLASGVLIDILVRARQVETTVDALVNATRDANREWIELDSDVFDAVSTIVRTLSGSGQLHAALDDLSTMVHPEVVFAIEAPEVQA